MMKKLSRIILCFIFILMPFFSINNAFPQESIEEKNEMCPIIGVKLRSDQAVNYEYEGETYKFCCAACVDEFKKDPDRNIRNLQKVESQTSSDVQYEICPIVNIDPTTMLKYAYKGKSYSFCCEACISDFTENPRKYLKNLQLEKHRYLDEEPTTEDIPRV